MPSTQQVTASTDEELQDRLNALSQQMGAREKLSDFRRRQALSVSTAVPINLRFKGGEIIAATQLSPGVVRMPSGQIRNFEKVKMRKKDRMRARDALFLKTMTSLKKSQPMPT